MRTRPSSVRLRIVLALMLGSACAGAVAGAVLTPLGKLVAGAPPATAANYAWNMVAFGVLAVVVSPLVTWASLRRVPLWRTFVEPLTGALLGAALALALGSAIAFLLLTPAGLVAAMVRLAQRYRDPAAQLAAGTAPVGWRTDGSLRRIERPGHPCPLGSCRSLRR